jgi:FAD/FMN-containing dehydrogenase
MGTHEAFSERAAALLGPSGFTRDAELVRPWLTDWRGRYIGRAIALASPKSTTEVAELVRLCGEFGVPIVPQGGNSGMCGGATPDPSGTALLLSLRRMNAIRRLDPAAREAVCEAGVILQTLHEAAAAEGLRFPLTLGGKGSATIGGLVSTNAGGTQVLRYGMARNLVLGLEAVLPTGEVWNGLKRLRKDNTGYDLKQLLIGAEGTLGVVTAAALKLYPQMASRAVAFIGVGSPGDAIKLLVRAKDETGGSVEAFELMGRLGIDFALRNIAGTRDPLARPHPWYVLAEFASGEPGSAEAAMERFLSAGLEEGLVADAVVAQTEAQAKALWAIRENQSPAQKPEGATWKHDVSVPVSQVARFLQEATDAMSAFAPGARIAAFGHVGDGNIHYDVLRPDGGSDAEHSARRDAGSRIVHDLVVSLGGSISAEHGLGSMKTAEALRYKSPVEVAAMRAIRQALDPKRIMNPRVLF